LQYGPPSSLKLLKYRLDLFTQSLDRLRRKG
jgi:hypothetical protein